MLLLQDHVCRPPDFAFTLLSVHQQGSEYIADQSLITNHHRLMQYFKGDPSQLLPNVDSLMLQNHVCSISI